MEIKELIRKKLDITTDIKLISAEFKENLLQVVFASIIEIKKPQRDEILGLINAEINNSDVKVIIKYIKIVEDEDVVINHVKNYFNEFYSSLPLSKIQCELENKKILIYTTQETELFVKKNKIDNDLEYKLSNYFTNEFTVEFIFEETNIEGIKKAQVNQMLDRYFELQKKPTKIKISNVFVIYGKIDEREVLSIDNFKTETESAVLVGKIKFLSERKTQDKEKDGVKIEGKKFYTFSLNDTTGNIKCIMFTNSKSLDKLDCLEDGMNVVASGRIEKFNDKLNFSIRYISKCNFELIEKDTIKIPIPEVYSTVIPEKYVNCDQLELFNIDLPVNNFLKDKSFVVFDFETTGLDANLDAVTELGAIKIVNGKITETFSTFINPNRHIPNMITEITHITDDMVKDAPQPEAVMLDFYKFTYNCAIVGHNVEFDYKFLAKNASKIAIEFKNERHDTLFLARKYLPGLKNYKLNTVCEATGVILSGAHRAVNDCLATGKAFIKLTDFIK